LQNNTELPPDGSGVQTGKIPVRRKMGEPLLAYDVCQPGFCRACSRRFRERNPLRLRGSDVDVEKIRDISDIRRQARSAGWRDRKFA